MSVKDEDEQLIISQASELCDSIINYYLLPEILRHIDDEIEISHSKLSNSCDRLLTDPNNKIRKWKFPKDIDYDLLDWVYQPTIQSGSNFDLRIAVPSNDEILSEGVIIISLAIRYKAYCAQLSRTYFINPDPEQEKVYAFLVELQDHVLKTMKPNVKCSQVYQSASDYVEKYMPEIRPYFVKNIGWSIGVEFREYLMLSNKCHHFLKAGSIIALILGFHGLKIDYQNDDTGNHNESTYSVLISDTVVINSDGTVTCLTKLKKDPKVVTYVFDKKQDNFKYQSNNTTGNLNGKASYDNLNRTLRSERRKRETMYAKESNMKREEIQKKLHDELQKNGIERYKNSKSAPSRYQAELFKKFESYTKDFQLPEKIKDNSIVIDKRNETVVIAVNGHPTPFHIFTIKSASATEEQDYSYLRINFMIASKGKKDYIVPEKYANHMFIKSLTIKSSKIGYIAQICKDINELKKTVTKREQELKEKENLVVQPNLIESTGKLTVLTDVLVRPQIDKRAQGTVELHANGLRYVHNSRNLPNIDVLYDNIKHLFFQSCDSELVVIINLHLNHPIIIGKRKTSDIQFYREISDSMCIDTSPRRNRRANYDYEDEIEIEKEESDYRAKLNEQFLKFSKAIQDASGLDMQIPVRAHGFYGISGRQMLLYQPTKSCLVHLTELPFVVITIAEVELVHLERVQFGLKNFDMVFIYKDYSRPVTHINSIPVNKLESVKQWLYKVEIPFTEGPANLSWTEIMKIINDDPYSFFKTGGWSFLLPADDEESDDDEDSGSEFEPVPEELEADESSTDYSSEEESSIEEPEDDDDDDDYDDDDDDDDDD